MNKAAQPQQVVFALQHAWDTFASSTDVARWAASFLADPNLMESVWAWLLEKARAADKSQRIALTIGVFELLVEHPRNTQWEDLLFGTIQDPNLHWIFVEIYELKPTQFYDDFQSHCNRKSCNFRFTSPSQ